MFTQLLGVAVEVEYLEEALEEAEAAGRWYAERSARAAVGFSEEIEAAESSISRLSEAWPMSLPLVAEWRTLRRMREGGLGGDMPEVKAARTRFEHADPILNVANLARSLRYYVDVLGFTNAEWGGTDFTCVSRDGASIYLCEGGQGQPGTWVWVGVEDVAALHDEYSHSGATILQPPENFPWAYEMKVGDPDGHVLRFGSDPKEAA